MRYEAASFVAVTVLTVACSADRTATTPRSGEELLARAIAYHDPELRWFARHNHFVLRQLRPGTPERSVELSLPPASDAVRIVIEEGPSRVAGEMRDGACEVLAPVDSSAVARFGSFDCDAMAWWRDYYSYQLSPPMNLRDAAASVDSAIARTAFRGDSALALTVRYGPGQPVWDYFFDPQTGRALGVAFSSDGARRDGEYIVFEGEVEADGVRLPKTRTWYHADGDELAGTDIIEEFAATDEFASPSAEPQQPS